MTLIAVTNPRSVSTPLWNLCHYTSKVEVWFRYIHIQLKIKDRCAVFKSIHTLDIEIKLICCLGKLSIKKNILFMEFSIIVRPPPLVMEKKHFFDA